MDKNKFIPIKDVAKELGTSERNIAIMALNGTFPCAAVAPPQRDGGKYTVRIVRERYIKWMSGIL